MSLFINGYDFCSLSGSLYSSPPPPMTTAGLAAAYTMLAAGKTFPLPLPAHHHASPNPNQPPSLLPSAVIPPPGLPLNCPKVSETLANVGRQKNAMDMNFNLKKENVVEKKEMEKKLVSCGKLID